MPTPTVEQDLHRNQGETADVTITGLIDRFGVAIPTGAAGVTAWLSVDSNSVVVVEKAISLTSYDAGTGLAIELLTKAESLALAIGVYDWTITILDSNGELDDTFGGKLVITRGPRGARLVSP